MRRLPMPNGCIMVNTSWRYPIHHVHGTWRLPSYLHAMPHQGKICEENETKPRNGKQWNLFPITLKDLLCGLHTKQRGKRRTPVPEEVWGRSPVGSKDSSTGWDSWTPLPGFDFWPFLTGSGPADFWRVVAIWLLRGPWRCYGTCCLWEDACCRTPCARRLAPSPWQRLKDMSLHFCWGGYFQGHEYGEANSLNNSLESLRARSALSLCSPERLVPTAPLPYRSFPRGIQQQRIFTAI